MIISSDQIKKQLYEQNRDYRGRNIWNEAYNTMIKSAQQQQTAAGDIFSSAVGEAYKQASRNTGIIAASNLSEQGRQSLYESNEKAIEEAYNKSLQTYAQTSSSIQQSLQEGVAQLDAQADLQAQNFIKYRQAYLDYYDYLASLDTTGNEALSSTEFRQYGGAFGDDKAASRDVLLSRLYDGETGELTAFGQSFFQMIQNISNSESGTERSFYDWLGRTDKELFDWASSGNVYDFTSGTPSVAGTNAASAEAMLGLKGFTGDYKYTGGYNVGLSELDRKNTVSGMAQNTDDSTVNVLNGNADETDKQAKLRQDVDLIAEKKDEMSKDEYREYLAKNGVYVLDESEYYVQGLGSGRTNDDIDITIGSNKRDKKTEFDLLSSNDDKYIVKNENYISTFNKLTTGNSSQTPKHGTLLMYADDVYIYTDKYGWRRVTADNNPEDYTGLVNAIKNRKYVTQEDNELSPDEFAQKHKTEILNYFNNPSSDNSNVAKEFMRKYGITLTQMISEPDKIITLMYELYGEEGLNAAKKTYGAE